MKKIFLSILSLAFVFNCSNNSTSSVPSEDDYYGGSLYSTDETASSPNGIRIYGNWTFNDPETGVEVSYKWMGVVAFNDDGKVHNFADWFDVSSIPSQIAGTYKR